MRVEKADLRQQKEAEEHGEPLPVPADAPDGGKERGRGEIEKADDLRIPVELVIHAVYPAEHEDVAEKLLHGLGHSAALHGANKRGDEENEHGGEIGGVNAAEAADVEGDGVPIAVERAENAHAGAEKEDVNAPEEVEEVIPRLRHMHAAVEKEDAQNGEAHDAAAEAADLRHIVTYRHGRHPSHSHAARAAVEPSATAVVSWRTVLRRQSPATKTPGVFVRQLSSEAA